MKLMVIKGNVIGGHYIKDLGLSVPYQTKKRIHFDRASWSSDLAYALQKGLVTKEKVINSDRENRVKGGSGESGGRTKKKTRKPIQKKSIKKAPSVPSKSQSSSTSDDTKALLEKLDQVVAGQHQVVEAQKTLVTKISNLLEDQETSESSLSAQKASSLSKEDLKEILSELSISSHQAPKDQHRGRSHQGSQDRSADSKGDEDDVIFIPSKIRSNKTKVSPGMKVEESTSERSGVDDAAKALAAMKRQSKSSGNSNGE